MISNSLQLIKKLNRTALLQFAIFYESPIKSSRFFSYISPFARMDSLKRNNAKSTAPAAATKDITADTTVATIANKNEQPPSAQTHSTKSYKSMWEFPGSHRAMPLTIRRMDETHYKKSDIGNRQYAQTWVDFPQRKLAKKPRFDFETLQYTN